MTQGLSFVAINLEIQGSCLESVLLASGGNVAQAAARLGMTEADLWHQLRWRFPQLLKRAAVRHSGPAEISDRRCG
jgi:transcriptional regulator with GAF, ATPase, and Fis domain